MNDTLKEAFRRQCKHFGPHIAYMAWHISGDLPEDTLLDIMKEFNASKSSNPSGMEEDSMPMSGDGT